MRELSQDTTQILLSTLNELVSAARDVARPPPGLGDRTRWQLARLGSALDQVDAFKLLDLLNKVFQPEPETGPLTEEDVRVTIEGMRARGELGFASETEVREACALLTHDELTDVVAMYWKKTREH
jgi:hypothetical protein